MSSETATANTFSVDLKIKMISKVSITISHTEDNEKLERPSVFFVLVLTFKGKAKKTNTWQEDDKNHNTGH